MPSKVILSYLTIQACLGLTLAAQESPYASENLASPAAKAGHRLNRLWNMDRRGIYASSRVGPLRELIESRQFAQAMALIEEGIEILRPHLEYSDFGMAFLIEPAYMLRAAGRTEDALRLVEIQGELSRQTLAKKSDRPRVDPTRANLELRALLLVELGRLEEAERLLEEAVKLPTIHQQERDYSRQEKSNSNFKFHDGTAAAYGYRHAETEAAILLAARRRDANAIERILKKLIQQSESDFVGTKAFYEEMKKHPENGHQYVEQERQYQQVLPFLLDFLVPPSCGLLGDGDRLCEAIGNMMRHRQEIVMPGDEFFSRRIRSMSAGTALGGAEWGDDELLNYHRRNPGFSWVTTSEASPKQRTQSAEWLINYKGDQHHADYMFAALLSEIADAELTKARGRLKEARSLTSAAAFVLPRVDFPLQFKYPKESDFTNVGRLKYRLEVLAGAVRADGAERKVKSVDVDQILQKRFGRPMVRTKWVELEQVRSELQPDEWLVDVTEFQYCDFHARPDQPLWKGHRYAAWLIPPAGAGDVQVIDLGPSDEINAAVDRARKGLQAGDQELVSDEPAAELHYRRESADLAGRLWGPLAPHLASAKKLSLCLDRNLWLLPWEILPVEESSYLVEQFEFRYVSSAKDLIVGTIDLPLSPPVVVANPNFGRQSAKASAVNAVRRSLLPPVEPLPGTITEAEAIVPLLASISGQTPLLLTGDLATQTQVQKLVRPQILVFSTHGFALDSNLLTDNPHFYNPLQKAGLQLAGCNIASGQLDDGILTAYEVLDMELAGTELVVLSACDTAIGDIRSGESLIGLRQAFHIAGAKSILASAWPVDDARTAQLMAEFFSNIRDGKSRSVALREAQLKQIANRRELFGAAHPYFWGAFTLTGH